MVRDPFCGAQIQPHHAACRSVYKGRTHYFCCPSCQFDFLQSPERWLRQEQKIAGLREERGPRRW
jgi:Cu+-exporting ATPase